jgi:enoyl-[acyl-carrier-protein] reductase (NADH)
VRGFGRVGKFIDQTLRVFLAVSDDLSEFALVLGVVLVEGVAAFVTAWDIEDPTPVARTVCALLSDWLPTTTGSMVWADGGFHALGL